MNRTLRVFSLGVIDYTSALGLQKRLVPLRQAQQIPDTLLLLEHPSVITMGRRTHNENFLFPPEFYKEKKIKVIEIDRGGDLTFHEPGQLVAYFIFDLKQHGGVREFVYKVEESLIDAVQNISGVKCGRDAINTGVYVGNNKLAAIGFSIKHGVSMHGFALNLNNDLDTAKYIVPCGLKERGVTSLVRETGKTMERPQADRAVIGSVKTRFQFDEIVTLQNEKDLY